ncbi:DUF2206 domain-containing protein [Chloroflexota bacterium]
MLAYLATKKFLFLILPVILAMDGLIGLAALGFDILILRQVVGFVFLSLVPGFLILRIVKLHHMGIVEYLLYSVGLSIAFVMFLGYFINLLLPLIGISEPISTLPLMLTINFCMLIFCVIAYKQKDPTRNSSSISIRCSELFSPPVLVLLLLPILSALGANLVYLHQGNTVLLILLSLIALIVIIVAFSKFIPSKLYPLAIITISIAVLWHWALISPDIPGSDVVREHAYQTLILENSFWNTNFGASNLNAMLSVVMLGPIYSLMLNLDLAWVLKIIYTLLFSLVPLALFEVYRRQFNKKTAFFGAFFFLSMPVFFTLTPGARQPIAEIFFALTILLFQSKKTPLIQKSFLLTIFGFSMVVSHYAISYIFLLYLLLTFPLLLLWRKSRTERWWERITTGLSRLRHSRDNNHLSSKPLTETQQRSILSLNYVILFVVFCVWWYLNNANGLPFDSIIIIGKFIYESFRWDFWVSASMDPHISQALGMAAMRGGELVWTMARIFQYITQLFIAVGIIRLVVNWRKTKNYPEYIVMSLISMVILAISIILPRFSQALSMMRIYHITLFFLAPFCILGGIAVSRWLFRILRFRRLRQVGTSAHINLIGILVLVPYFLFSTGFIFEVSGATATSMPLSLYQTDWEFFTKPEIKARTWLFEYTADTEETYTDTTDLLLRGSSGRTFSVFPLDNEQMSGNSYVFLRRWNLVQGEWKKSRATGAPHFPLEQLDYLKNMNITYNSGDAQILRP